MENIKSVFIALVILLIYVSCTSSEKRKTSVETSETDILELIYFIADEMDMKIMCDIDMIGGDLYQKKTAEELIRQSNYYMEEYHEKYGSHASFWGWYLNNELNPLEQSDVEQSLFWRTIWKSVVDKSKAISPGTKVTISPFFLLDKEGYRGFKYLNPEIYEEWWYHTMKETGIDILMLQDSGAEHLSFFTLEDRKPFFQAFANACRKAGKEFWMNVETGQVEAKDWAHALQMEKDFDRKWAFTEINWLKQKLDLAAEYATGIINWGYYPLMNPVEEYSVLTIQDIDGQPVELSSRKNNYDAYKDYVDHLSTRIPQGKLTRPKLNGTLWFLPLELGSQSREELEKAVGQEILNQKEVGFEFLWICNTPKHFKPASSENNK